MVIFTLSCEMTARGCFDLCHVIMAEKDRQNVCGHVEVSAVVSM